MDGQCSLPASAVLVTIHECHHHHHIIFSQGSCYFEIIMRSAGIVNFFIPWDPLTSLDHKHKSVVIQVSVFSISSCAHLIRSPTILSVEVQPQKADLHNLIGALRLITNASTTSCDLSVILNHWLTLLFIACVRFTQYACHFLSSKTASTLMHSDMKAFFWTSFNAF